MNLTRIALGLSYDGSAFEGWQSQPSGRTVQDALERALGAVANEPIRVVAAGRTDTGVHATGQVVHFDTTALRRDYSWVRGVNSALPAAIAVQWATSVDAEFSARFSARGRTYRYALSNGPVRPALFARQLGWFHRPLDLIAMQAAAAALIGRHDFTSFRAAGCQAKTPLRNLRRLDISRAGSMIIFTVEADAFLHHMVRNIVGALVYVGKGNHPAGWIAELLAARDRRLAAPTFGPEGLYLTAVEYDAKWRLPSFSASLPWLVG